MSGNKGKLELKEHEFIELGLRVGTDANGCGGPRSNTIFELFKVASGAVKVDVDGRPQSEYDQYADKYVKLNIRGELEFGEFISMLKIARKELLKAFRKNQKTAKFKHIFFRKLLQKIKRIIIKKMK